MLFSVLFLIGFSVAKSFIINVTLDLMQYRPGSSLIIILHGTEQSSRRVPTAESIKSFLY